MTFAAPWVLAALVIMPVLYWLLRATPPAPVRQVFPAVRLLLGLRPREEKPVRTPWWLLLLRLLAVCALIVGLANPVRRSGLTLPGSGPLTLVLDDGFAAAPDFAVRLRAAGRVLDRAAEANRPVALLPVSATVTPPLRDARDAAAELAALRPKPYQPDRAAAAAALAALGTAGVVFIGDGAAHEAAGDAAFAQALPSDTLTVTVPPTDPVLLRPPRTEGDRLIAKISVQPSGVARTVTVLAETAQGRALAQTDITLPPGAVAGEAAFDLPPDLWPQLARLAVRGVDSAGAVALMDDASRQRPVGLIGADNAGADQIFTGPYYYVARALAGTETRSGDVPALLARPVSMLVMADRDLSPQDADAVAAWVRGGGLLVRFAGPKLAARTADGGAAPDPLLPFALIAGDRRLGGAMSWSKPAALAPFPPGSPFAGLDVPPDVTVSQQVLAQPGGAPPGAPREEVWATLADGTPLVSAAGIGRGRIVLVHVTANADWSDLPLSGLFVSMLERLKLRAAGVALAADARPLPAVRVMDGFGVLGPPAPRAEPLPAEAFAARADERHLPGLYGPEGARRALNVGTAEPDFRPAPAWPGRTEDGVSEHTDAAYGPALIALAMILLGLDGLIALRLRGLLRPLAAAALALGLIGPAHADPAAAALTTRIGLVRTGVAATDREALAGLKTLSEEVNRRTAVVLAGPDTVIPGTDDLSVYPLLYWQIAPGAAQPAPGAITALNAFMDHGGILVIDTAGADADAPGSGAGMFPGARAALRAQTRGLSIPPLASLGSDHVLARAFYLLTEFPGRFAGDDVFVARDADAENDGVTPLVIGGAGWASSWAEDASGTPLHAAIPGGARQRTLSLRFGINLVVYALTGNYKGDQVHIPAILERLGQ